MAPSKQATSFSVMAASDSAASNHPLHVEPHSPAERPVPGWSGRGDRRAARIGGSSRAEASARGGASGSTSVTLRLGHPQEMAAGNDEVGAAAQARAEDPG